MTHTQDVTTRQGTRIEMLSIGDELLDGRVADTNTVYLGQALTALGLRLAARTSIPDDLDAITHAASAIAARGTTLCVVSGGLGPTSDDITAEAFARWLGVPVSRDDDQIERIKARLARRGFPVLEAHLKQADYPTGAERIANPVGSAIGFRVHKDGCDFVALPGVPKEYEAMLNADVIAPLRAIHTPALRRSFYCYGVIEAEAQTRLQELLQRWPMVRVGYRVKFPEVHVTLTAAADQQRHLDAAADHTRTQLGKHVYSEETNASLAHVVLNQLRQRGATLAIAESCTGGLIGDMLTDISGSSDVLLLDVVAYANSAKADMLGVPNTTLQAHGAVSEQTVLAMAQGVRTRAGATYGIAVTGIAGPSGGTPDKPVGTVWIAACDGHGWSRVRQLHSPFDRRGNKLVSAYAVLDNLRRGLLDLEHGTVAET